MVILHPKERVSYIQERQMTTVLDDNIHNIAIDGTFDDCQDIVKALFRDAEFRKRHRLAAINSINWARILAQITYYFYAFFRVQEFHEKDGAGSGGPGVGSKRKGSSQGGAWRKAQFSVPSGNFGNVLAGYYARCMGLPIATLIVGTNANDVLYRFFSTGNYSKSTLLVPTLTPAMDIQISSNFERLLFHTACEGNPHSLGKLFKQFAETGGFAIENNALARVREGFKSFRFDDDLVIDCIQKYYFRDESEKASGQSAAFGDAIAAISSATSTNLTTRSNSTFRMPVKLDAEKALTVKTGPVLLDPHTAIGTRFSSPFDSWL